MVHTQVSVASVADTLLKESIDFRSVVEDELAKILKEEIDWELLVDLMCTTCGWTKVELKKDYTLIDLNEIDQWCKETCTGSYKSRDRMFIFENNKDAEWFILRWM